MAFDNRSRDGKFQIMNHPRNLEYQVLVGQSKTQLELFAESLGEQSYRGRQLFDWLYHQKNDIIDEMTDLPVLFREQVKKSAIVHPLVQVTQSDSGSKQTKKFLFQLQDGNQIESVLMKEKDRTTICISTQVGCAVNCDFCATAAMGFIQNLSAGEIVDQFLQLKKFSSGPITNVVFMGMGEPLLNYKNVIAAADLLHDPDGINMGAKRITISTAGIIPKIKQFTAEAHKYKLAISLNGSTQEQRLRTMPISAAQPLEELLAAATCYTRENKTRVTFEYVLIKDINEKIEDAQRLQEMLSPINCKLNVIPYNEIGGVYVRPDNEKIQTFLSALKKAPFPVTVRWSKGVGIDAGCGQLATKTG